MLTKATYKRQIKDNTHTTKQPWLLHIVRDFPQELKLSLAAFFPQYHFKRPLLITITRVSASPNIMYSAGGALSRDKLPISNQPCMRPEIPEHPSTAMINLLVGTLV